MNSSNHLETCAAVNAVCKLITSDMVPAVINDVTKLLRHEMYDEYNTCIAEP
jgi:AP-4 complex subunit epsilon-1